jgi:hypothetical protein
MRELAEERDDRTPSGFEPDTLLPTQFFDRLRARERSGEWRLMVAILQDAVDVYLKQAGAKDAHHERLFAEAEEWIEERIEERDGRYVFSFESICDVLGMDPDYLRGGLHRWKERVRGRAAERRETTDADEAPDREELRRASGA